MTLTHKVLLSSESNEWYTPQQFTDAAREVMGGIDIDPASNAMAQKWIQATTYYTKEDDGLYKPWQGRLWLNPPYGQKNKAEKIYGASAWIEFAIAKYLKGEVTEAIILCRGDSLGVHQLEARFPSCEPCDRISFVNPVDPTKKNPVPGCRFWYLGSNLDRFHQVFSRFGPIRVVHGERYE